MQYYDTLFVRVALASSLGSLIAIGLNGPVLGAGTCIQAPDLDAGQGRHWYYRVDRINHRKCWYMTEAGPRTDEAPSLGPSPTSSPNLTLFSWFPWLSAGLPGSATAGMQPSTSSPQPRVPSAAPKGNMNVVHAVPNERSRPTRPPETKGLTTAERDQQSSRSSADHAEQVNSQPPDQAAQDALFLEFLRWKELQKSVK
jgi:hypothetical protein